MLSPVKPDSLITCVIIVSFRTFFCLSSFLFRVIICVLPAEFMVTKHFYLRYLRATNICFFSHHFQSIYQIYYMSFLTFFRAKDCTEVCCTATKPLISMFSSFSKQSLVSWKSETDGSALKYLKWLMHFFLLSMNSLS